MINKKDNNKANKNHTTAREGKPSGLSVTEDFLWESNAIENEYSHKAFVDAKKAWKYIKDKENITLEDALEIHRILMKRLRPDIAGKLRTCSVRVGNNIMPYHGLGVLEDSLKRYCEVTNGLLEFAKVGIKDEEALEKACKESHISFEKIHPFEDGNGRTGRILMNWLRIRLGLPILVIHADLKEGGSEQKEYYEWFN